MIKRHCKYCIHNFSDGSPCVHCFFYSNKPHWKMVDADMILKYWGQ